MSVDQLPPGKARTAAREAQLVRYGEYVDKQIESTRQLVKVVDVMTAMMVIVTGTVGFLLTAAVVEHWLVPDGFSVAVRLLLFAVLVGGVGYYAVRRLWPLCVSSINPAYAAQAIEHDNPTLKNSLLNLLLFRQHREEVTDAVYETLEEQAAQRLTRVPIDSAVDRTQLLRLGYALMVVVAIAAAYKIFSPKDPLVTAERVLMPWADVVPSSRVSIQNVEPGAVTLARGEVLTVSADIRGISDDDPVVVRYTTADGQAVDRPAAMTPISAGLRFTGQIPPAVDGAKAGVAQNLRYRIEAGDARSREYTVTVVAAPTITVERIDYDYPDYTGFADRSIERLGDIRAIEGTRVTIHARANQSIKQAAVDFEADGRRDITLNVDGNEARTGFQLSLRDDRQTPKFTSYVLRFTDVEGRMNRDPVKYPIDVLPDYAPEVAILAPKEKARDVRLDETVAIEVEARDPDFSLAEVHLQGDAAGRKVIDEPLLAKQHTGRFTGRLLFTPSERGLKPGDVVRYWVTARDDRPNEVTSDSQTLRITSPDPQRPGQPPPDHLAQRDKPESQPNEDSSQGNEQQGEGAQGGGASDSAQGNEGQQDGEGASAGGQPGENSEQSPDDQPGAPDSQQNSDQPGQSESGESQSNESRSDGESGGERNADGQSAPGEQGGKSGEAQQQPGGNASDRSGDSASENNSQQPSARQQSNSASENAGDSKSQSGSNSDDAKQRENSSRDGQPQGGDPSSPVSPEGDDDGTAFDRIQEFLKRDGRLPEHDEGNDGGEDAPARPKSEGASANGPSDRADEPSDDGKQAEDSRSTDGEPASSQGESGAGGEPEQHQGAPDSQPDMKPADKWQQKPSGEQQGQNEESPSGARGKRESDSQGNEGGDRTGSGEEGGGQESNRDGTGSSGQNQSADEGAGESSEQGSGENSSNAGEDAPSDRKTGEEGWGEAGEGSSQRDSTGDQAGGKNGGEDAPARSEGEDASAGGQKPKDSTNEKSSSPTDQQEQPGRDELQNGTPGGEDAPARLEESQGSQQSGTNAAEGAGRVPDGAQQPTKTDGTAPDADAANLEYARKQTDLVLETLDEQLKRQKVDKRLLDELGWTEADLQRFLARWQQLKAAASEDTPSADDAQRELDDALRSLGLRRGPLQQSKVTDDKQRDLRQGYRGAVPLEYQERLRAYNQGVSRARQQDE